MSRLIAYRKESYKELNTKEDMKEREVWVFGR